MWVSNYILITFQQLIQLFVTSFFMSAFFCKAKKELPLVAFFYQQKIVAISKSFSLLSGLNKTN
jgi:hypothetical protein